MDEIFALWAEPLGEVRKSKISAQRENKVIKLYIIWLQSRQSLRNRENFYIAFIFRHNFVAIIKFRKEIFFRTPS